MPGQEAAETLALRVLAWFLEAEDRRMAFMAATGAQPADLARGAGDPVFLAAVLDVLLGDEQMVRDFCAAHALPLDAPLRARAALPGGQVPHWT
jgi:hypothetical protein